MGSDREGKEMGTRMEQNANGTWFCYDCWCIVLLFDDDEHDCTDEIIRRGPNVGQVVA